MSQVRGNAEGEVATESEVRAGARVLGLFATPLSRTILSALGDGPMRLAELQSVVESIPQTTLRGQLKILAEVGSIARRSREGNARAVDYELTALGFELLQVAQALDRWLAQAPGAPIDLDSDRGRAAVKALANGWDSTILRALAARPLSLTDLDNLIDTHSYASLERRLSTMGATGQVEPLPSGARTLYKATDWVRLGIAPLAMAGRCERRHMAGITAPITHVEVEAAFMLTLPLVSLPRRHGGACVLAVYTGEEHGDGRPIAGIRVEVEAGQVLDFDERIEHDPPSWCLGSAGAWMDSVIDGGVSGLRIGGSNPRLATGLVSGLHTALFG